MNCWEFKNCGQGKGSPNSCPAYPEYGQICARVVGTFCGGKVQGEFAVKLPSCMQCNYYKSEHYNKQYSN